MRADDHPASSIAMSFLNCPRCGLSIRQRAGWLTIEHCPRCIARARVAVNLLSSPLPAVELYGERSEPHCEQRGGSQSQLSRSLRGESGSSIRDPR
jgi:hypothetical protein